MISMINQKQACRELTRRLSTCAKPRSMQRCQRNKTIISHHEGQPSISRWQRCIIMKVLTNDLCRKSGFITCMSAAALAESSCQQHIAYCFFFHNSDCFCWCQICAIEISKSCTHKDRNFEIINSPRRWMQEAYDFETAVAAAPPTQREFSEKAIIVKLAHNGRWTVTD